MSSDRFIYFEPGKVPSSEDVGTLIEDYLGAAMVSKEWDASRWTVLLSGTISFPFVRLEPEWVPSLAARAEAGRKRSIEVYIGEDYIDVLTRSQDRYTSVLADGLVELVAHYWEGNVEQPGAPVVQLSLAERFLDWYPRHTNLYIRGAAGKDWKTRLELDQELADVLNPFLQQLVSEAVAEHLKENHGSTAGH